MMLRDGVTCHLCIETDRDVAGVVITHRALLIKPSD